MSRQLCSDEMAAKARRLAKKTGVDHAVIDVSRGGGRGYQKIVKMPVNTMAESRSGVLTTLYVTDCCRPAGGVAKAQNA